MKILNVGSGNRPMPNERLTFLIKNWFDIKFTEEDTFINIDKIDLGQDYVIDLEKLEENPLPFKDNEFDHIMMIHTFEHITNVIPLMDELWRVCKKEGKCLVVCPYWTHKWSVGDIDHKRQINEYSFLWFSQEFYKDKRNISTACSPCLVKCNWVCRFDNMMFLKDHKGEIQDIRFEITCKK